MATEQKVLNEGNAKHAYEFLQLIDKAEGDEKVKLITKWGNTSPLNMILSLNFNHKIALELPPGPPPFKRDEATHPDMMSPTAGQINRLKACVKTNPIKKFHKERTFIQVLEMIPPKDADAICAAKDHTLTDLYPSITKELVKSVFPNFVSE